MSNYRIPLAQDTISSDELCKLAEWISAGNRLTKGPLTHAFEQAFAEALNVKYAIFVNSGSSANLLALYALMQSETMRSGPVIVPAVSWVTTVTPALQFGRETLLCDCDPAHLGLDLNHLEALFKRHNPAAVIVVHVLGHPGDMDELNQLCKHYGVVLIEDACEALGTTYGGRALGTFGEAGTFSFYYGHQISTIEGGMVVTNDRRLYNIAKSLRAHGWSRDVDDDAARAWEAEFDIDEFRRLYSFYYPGFNCRSTDLNAFLGLSQISQIGNMIDARQRNFERYKEKLSGYWWQTSRHDRLSSLAYGTFVENRLEVFRHLRNRGIETRPLICGSMGRQPFWIRRFGEQRLQHADNVHDKGIYLPNHAQLTDQEIDEVAACFREVAEPSRSM